MTFEEAGLLLDQVAESLPQDFFRDLTGGIILSPEVKFSPHDQGGDLYLLGTYSRNTMGRYINIYYGSFVKVYGTNNPEKFAEELRATLLHEFTHHLESLAGEHGLEDDDDVRLARYKLNKKKSGENRP